MNKRWKFRQSQHEEVAQLQEALSINPIFCELLVQRGVKTYEAAERFFRPKLDHLHDPFLMKDMQKAVDRIRQAIDKGEKIMVYGDYDVDGTSAATLLMDFFGPIIEKINFYIPDRYEEGYGVSVQGVEHAASEGCTLMLTVDCGIRDVASIALAAEKGIDVIICDHHLPNTQLPNAFAILNPKQVDCAYPFKELSGCGVAFKLVQAFAMQQGFDFETKVQPLLDLVAISLCCDMVSLSGENRVLVFYGLIQFNGAPRMSLEVLRDIDGRRLPYTVRDVVFGIGPLLNAAGRMEHGREAVRMLLSKNRKEAESQAAYLMLKNQERRAEEAQMMQEAMAIIGDDPSFHDKRSTVVYQPHWHKGVIGIVAAKLAEHYNRPTIVFTDGLDGKRVGSARSVGNYDIHNAIGENGQHTVNYGGHKFAAGLTVNADSYDEFVTAFEQFVYHTLSTDDELPTLFIDAQLEMKQLNDKFWGILRQFAPFGPDNAQPVFLSKLVKDTGYSKLVKEEHIKMLVRQGDSEPIEGIAYGFGAQFPELSSRKPFHLCYAVEQNFFMGKVKLQLLVRDMKF